MNFSQYRQETHPPMYSAPPNYQSEMYAPYNPGKNYQKPVEGVQYDYPQVPSASPYMEPMMRNFGMYGKELEQNPASSQFNYARGFAQTPYSGFYSEPSFGISFLTLAEPVSFDPNDNQDKQVSELGYGGSEEKKEFSEKTYMDKVGQETGKEHGFGIFSKAGENGNNFKCTLFLLICISVWRAR
eukprot:TRINITY_DN822_c0_g1_i5.p3 TRINITY_DN822_c0_g1~~TRINITY_DN822_c0_g1_i5.p3  ORF type:complete len:185 (+),score=22.90 TRINITY_DN822_c0_g1_i5:645-1199(+)